MVNSLILSRVNYGIICYGRANKTSLKPLELIVNKALRCISFINLKDKIKTNKIYYDQGILKIQDTFNLQVAKFCFKYKNGLLPQIFRNFFMEKEKLYVHNTRTTSNNFYRGIQNSNSGFRKLEHLGAVLWNKIRKEIKETKSLVLFNKSYKRYLREKYVNC